ncbi:DUF2771 family protein [Corynebacterium amycolatum]|uniref:DUF2771 family protein n=1 Tax=Corynebacterium amycolatum TaxID=43765 RepID=UPI000185C375|nr:DUF2771 family protein [Corynebacterium amycolatum]EEB62340.1 hypothetical protein CORAM0001_1609 [Corynebacterium amycolatum SK46]
MVVGAIVVVGLVVTGIVLAVNKWTNQAIDDPRTLSIEVNQDGETTEVLPYRVCDLFEKNACTTTETNAAKISLGEQETAEVNVGSTVGSNSWTLQRFFSDDAVNSTSRKDPGEATTETIAGSAAFAGKRTPLGVVEVSTALIGKNSEGEETTYGITWSIVNEPS